MPRRPQATYSPPPSASTRSGGRWAAPGLQLCAVHSWAATSLFFSRFSYTHSRSSAQKAQPACLTSCPPISTPVTYTADLVPCTRNLDHRDWDMNEPRRPDGWPSPRPFARLYQYKPSDVMSRHRTPAGLGAYVAPTTQSLRRALQSPAPQAPPGAAALSAGPQPTHLATDDLALCCVCLETSGRMGRTQSSLSRSPPARGVAYTSDVWRSCTRKPRVPAISCAHSAATAPALSGVDTPSRCATAPAVCAARATTT